MLAIMADPHQPSSSSAQPASPTPAAVAAASSLLSLSLAKTSSTAPPPLPPPPASTPGLADMTSENQNQPERVAQHSATSNGNTRDPRNAHHRRHWLGHTVQPIFSYAVVEEIRRLHAEIHCGEQLRLTRSQDLDAHGCYLVKVNGDGNCLFRAFSDQLHGTQRHHLAIREAAVNYIRTHPEQFMSFVALEGGERRAPTRQASSAARARAAMRNSTTSSGTASRSSTSVGYDSGNSASSGSSNMQADQFMSLMRQCDTMSRPGTWGGNFEIVALARSYGKRVFIWNDQTGEISSFNTEAEGENDGEKVGPRDVLLAYHLNSHYSSMRYRYGTPPGYPNVLPSTEFLNDWAGKRHTKSTEPSGPQREFMEYVKHQLGTADNGREQAQHSTQAAKSLLTPPESTAVERPSYTAAAHSQKWARHADYNDFPSPPSSGEDEDGEGQTRGHTQTCRPIVQLQTCELPSLPAQPDIWDGDIDKEQEYDWMVQTYDYSKKTVVKIAPAPSSSATESAREVTRTNNHPSPQQTQSPSAPQSTCPEASPAQSEGPGSQSSSSLPSPSPTPSSIYTNGKKRAAEEYSADDDASSQDHRPAKREKVRAEVEDLCDEAPTESVSSLSRVETIASISDAESRDGEVEEPEEDQEDDSEDDAQEEEDEQEDEGEEDSELDAEADTDPDYVDDGNSDDEDITSVDERKRRAAQRA